MWNALATEARRRKRVEKTTKFMAGLQMGRLSLGKNGEKETGHSREYLYETRVKEVQYEGYHSNLDMGTWTHAHIHGLREGLSHICRVSGHWWRQWISSIP